MNSTIDKQPTFNQWEAHLSNELQIEYMKKKRDFLEKYNLKSLPTNRPMTHIEKYGSSNL